MKEMTTILADNYNTYNTSYDTVNSIKILSDLNNKLFCTFTDLDFFLSHLSLIEYSLLREQGCKLP